MAARSMPRRFVFCDDEREAPTLVRHRNHRLAQIEALESAAALASDRITNTLHQLLLQHQSIQDLVEQLMERLMERQLEQERALAQAEAKAAQAEAKAAQAEAKAAQAEAKLAARLPARLRADIKVHLQLANRGCQTGSFLVQAQIRFPQSASDVPDKVWTAFENDGWVPMSLWLL